MSCHYNSTTCEEHYDIDEDELEVRALDSESEYLDKCLEFWRDKKDTPIQELSHKQANWLEKIEESLQQPPRSW
jgi:hypothetical protein